jgi:hypothetical protein
MTTTPNKAEQFRARAAECDKRADMTTDAEHALMWRAAADEWRWLAKRAEELKKMGLA